MEAIIGCILLGIFVICLGFAGLMMIFLDIDLYFLKFKIEKHPKLLAIMENTVQNICTEEGIKVFNKTFEEININTPEGKDKAVGRYIYTISQEYQQTVNKCFAEIEELESKYKMPYRQLCVFVGHDTTIDKEDFILPRIQLCDEELKKFGIIGYYRTLFHELGHHFAVKEKGTEHNENDADRCGDILIKQNFPFYFRLFFNFQYRIDEKELTVKEKLIGYVGYLRYLITKNK